MYLSSPWVCNCFFAEIREVATKVLSSPENFNEKQLQDQWPKFLRRGLKLVAFCLLSFPAFPLLSLAAFLSRYHFSNARLLTAVAKAFDSGIKLKPGPREVFEMVTGHSQFRAVLLPTDWKRNPMNHRRGEDKKGGERWVGILFPCAEHRDLTLSSKLC